MKTTTATETCTATVATRCARRFLACTGKAAPEGIFGNFGYANLITVKGWIGAFRPFCDAP
jgi:hypothetical protein